MVLLQETTCFTLTSVLNMPDFFFPVILAKTSHEPLTLMISEPKEFELSNAYSATTEVIRECMREPMLHDNPSINLVSDDM